MADKRALLFSSLYYPNVGGIENSIKEFSVVLKAQGYDVIIITSNRDNVNDEVLEDCDFSNGVRIIRCDYPRSNLGFIFFLKSLGRVIKDLGVSDYDFIISRSHWPVLALRASGIKSVNYLAPSVYLFQTKISAKFLISRQFISYAINSFGQFLAFLNSRVYVFSEDMKGQIRSASLFFCNPDVIDPGVSKDKFFQVDEDQKNNIRKKLDLKGDGKYLLCVGRASEIKQFDIAIRSLKYLSANYQLLIVGSGPELKRLQLEAEYEGVGDRVTFRPFTSMIDLYYKSSDIYLMTSRYESFGQVLLEATSCGLPVIAFSRSSGVRTSVSYIYDGFRFLLFECHEANAESLARKIAELQLDAEAFKEEACLFSEKYSWTATVQKMK